jgi:hypothetical protein
MMSAPSASTPVGSIASQSASAAAACVRTSLQLPCSGVPVSPAHAEPFDFK